MGRLLLLTILLYCFSASATVQDTTDVKKDKWADYEHKPQRAALWSLFPGAGQIYNEIGYRRIPHKKHRAWWKVPIIYGGLGTCGYFYWFNYKEGKDRRNEWEARVADTTYTLFNPFNPKFLNVSTPTLESEYDDFARSRDIFLFATIAVYGLNIIEAFVDGHFVTFDVSEDLSLSCTPTMITPSAPGLHFRLSFN